jgi:protein tyrosine/serine phosphatase
VPIKNFCEVVPGILYRGSRPSPADIRGELSKMRTIIDLEGDDVSAEEFTSCKGSSISWLWVPISLADIYVDGFPDPLLDYLLDQIEACPKPLYIHCQHGEDRTGLAVAAYRIKHGMSPQAAYDEALKFKYHPHFNAGLNKNFEKLGAKVTDWVI